MRNFTILLTFSLLLASCSGDELLKKAASMLPKSYLYVASGSCYSGGNTTFSTTTSSNLVYRIDTSTGQKDITIADYNSFPASSGDSPVGLSAYDNDNIMILVENSTSGRRIETAAKKISGTRSPFSSSTTILSAVLRGLTKLSDNSVLVSKSSGVEKITQTGVRIGAPLIPSNLGATCGTAITLISSVSVLNNGNIVYTHAAAAQNRFGIISASGYLTAANCLAAQAAPTATSYPVASVYIAASNQLIVAYAGNSIATNINSIYAYDIDETTNAISGATVLYDVSLYPSTYNYLLYGISAMTYDSSTKSLYVATAVSTATTVVNYAIEKLSYEPSTKTLTRSGSTPFYNYGVDTKCISAMMVSN